MQLVRCVDCGFLGLRNHDTGTLDEADERFRTEAFFRGSPQIHDSLPICTKAVVNFRDEANPSDRPSIVQSLKKDRSCAEWTRWRIGFTPKEHQEMLNQQLLLNFQEKQRQDDRRFQAERKDADQKFQEGQQAALLHWQKGQNKLVRNTTIIAAAFGAIVGGLIAIIQVVAQLFVKK